MIKTAAFVMIIALRLIYQPRAVQQRNTPFASPPLLSSVARTNFPANLIGISGIKISNRIILKWIMGVNKAAWCIIPASTSSVKNGLPI